MASTVVHVPVAAGETAIRAGDRGDRFYMVADGQLEVTANGLHETLREHDFFGEIALLRDVGAVRRRGRGRRATGTSPSQRLKVPPRITAPLANLDSRRPGATSRSLASSA